MLPRCRFLLAFQPQLIRPIACMYLGRMFFLLFVSERYSEQESAVKGFNEIKESAMRELDYGQEQSNMEIIRETAGARYKSLIDVPRTFPHLCTDQVITMTYIEGPKLEEEVLRRLSAVGIDRQAITVRSFMADQADKLREAEARVASVAADNSWTGAWIGAWTGVLSRAAALVGPQTLLWVARKAQHARDAVVLTVCSVVGLADSVGLAPIDVRGWMVEAQRDLSTRHTEAETRQWLDTLLDVHGFEIFLCPLYNCDPHPGNIIAMDDGRLGLIDYGQCMAFTDETTKRNFASLLISVADNRPDAEVAEAFRSVGIRTEKSNDFFTASMAKLMFGHVTVCVDDPCSPRASAGTYYVQATRT
eukprot:m.121633 g.121633  ORF g.121633 m.121633 type:complete len:362 (-) comp21903_c0_seq12:5353-6438(-)